MQKFANNKTKYAIPFIFLLSLISYFVFFQNPEIKQILQEQSANDLSEAEKNSLTLLQPLAGPFRLQNSSQPPKSTENKTARLEIEGKIYENEIVEEISVYDFMTKLRSEGKINFKEITYTGMGKFIEEINGMKSGNGKYWIYYVNGKKAEIGISNYKITSGDIVSWKLEEDIN